MGPLPPIPAAVHQLHIEKRGGGHGVRLWVDDLAGLLGLVEIGAVELHPWGATVDDIERPDLLVFDLDPGEGIAWDFVVETAFALREMLATYGLECWPKTTGGKGLHVMVPVAREMSWDAAHAMTRRIAQQLAATDQVTMSLRPNWRSALVSCSSTIYVMAAARPRLAPIPPAHGKAFRSPRQ